MPSSDDRVTSSPADPRPWFADRIDSYELDSRRPSYGTTRRRRGLLALAGAFAVLSAAPPVGYCVMSEIYRVAAAHGLEASVGLPAAGVVAAAALLGATFGGGMLLEASHHARD
jgi:hypothetical protein